MPTINDFLDKTIKSNTGGSWESVNDSIVRVSIPKGFETKQVQDAHGNLVKQRITLHHSFTVNVHSEKFPDNLFLQDIVILPEDMELLKQATMELQPNEQAKEANEEESGKEEILTDSRGVIFDPKIHAVNVNGKPVLTRFKTFKRK